MKATFILFVLVYLNSSVIKADEEIHRSKTVSVYHTLAHEIILAEPNIVSKQKAVNKLDNLIDQAKQILNTRHHYSKWQSEDIFRTIYMMLINAGYDYRENDFLSVGLVDGKLDCDNYTAIYYSIAQVMHFPIYIVNLPKHSALLWDEDGKHNPLDANSPENKGDYYWETTLGEIRSDSEYIRSYKISTVSLYGKTFMDKLNNDDMLAIVYNNRAIRELQSGNYSNALNEIGKSLQLNPNFPEALNNSGIIYSRLNDYRNAILNYDQAIKEYPDFTLALVNKGIALEKTDRFEEAIKYYTDAIKVDSDFTPAYKLRAYAYLKAGNPDAALSDLSVFQSLMK